METRETRAIADLIKHPKNNYFFDDIEGAKWNEFKESIRTSGVIEPVVITQDNVIVSGHQRVRGCEEEGMKEVPVWVKEYSDEDAILKDLIESNVRQRNDISGSVLKLGRIIVELERLYDIQRGGDRRSNSHNETLKTDGGGEVKNQEDIMDMLHIGRNTYYRAKSLPCLIPELQDGIQDGKITATTATELLAKLSPEDQKVVYESLPKDVKLSQKEVKEYIDALLKEKDEQIKSLDEDVTDMVERVTQAIRAKTEAEERAKIAEIEAASAKKMLQTKEDEIAGQYIQERDVACESARKAHEKFHKLKEQVKGYESKQKELEAKVAELESRGYNEDAEKEIALLKEQIDNLTVEKEKKTSSYDLDGFLRFIRDSSSIFDGYVSNGTVPVGIPMAPAEAKKVILEYANRLRGYAEQIESCVA